MRFDSTPAATLRSGFSAVRRGIGRAARRSTDTPARRNTGLARRADLVRFRCGTVTVAAMAVVMPLTSCTAGHPATSAHTASTAAAQATTTIGGSALHEQFAGLETRFGARLGVFAVDTGSGHTVEYRADERFPFCSTFKSLEAGAVLASHGTPAELDRRITYTHADILAYAPITKQHVAEGMTIRDLMDAAVRFSDNTAANLLFGVLGGPHAFQQDMRSLGDQVTSSDRLESALDEATPGDTRDTSTPRAFATDLRTYVLGSALPPDNRALLTTMLRTNTTGADLIRAGVPAGWVVGDKTGNGDYGTRNDIAVIWPPNRAPIVLDIMSTRPHRDDTYDNALIAQATGAAVQALS
jgi:beta-lactamase class A